MVIDVDAAQAANGDAPPLSPDSVFAILATADVGQTACAIAYGLIATVKKRDDQYKQEYERLQEIIKEKDANIEGLTCQLEEERAEPLEQPPDGYEHNAGCIDIQIPMGDDMFLPAKWIRLCSDGKVEAKSGHSRMESPTITEMYLTPRRNLSHHAAPAEAMPMWFEEMLQGSSSTFSMLRTAVEDLDDWAAVAEVERMRGFYLQARKVNDAIKAAEAEESRVRTVMRACRERMERAHLPSQLSYLEVKTFPSHELMDRNKRKKYPGGPGL